MTVPPQGGGDFKGGGGLAAPCLDAWVLGCLLVIHEGFWMVANSLQRLLDAVNSWRLLDVSR